MIIYVFLILRLSFDDGRELIITSIIINYYIILKTINSNYFNI